jgi:hypothetical protein
MICEVDKMSDLEESLKEEKKSCRTCAYLSKTAFALGSRYDTSLRGVGHTIGEPTFFGLSSCKQKSPSFNEKNLDNNSCEKFLRKKAGMTLEQQIEEQKKSEELEKQARTAKEYSKLSNRLKRNWYYVSALIIAIIGLVIAIWKFALGK